MIIATDIWRAIKDLSSKTLGKNFIPWLRSLLLNAEATLEPLHHAEKVKSDIQVKEWVTMLPPREKRKFLEYAQKSRRTQWETLLTFLAEEDQLLHEWDK